VPADGFGRILASRWKAHTEALPSNTTRTQLNHSNLSGPLIHTRGAGAVGRNFQAATNSRASALLCKTIAGTIEPLW
jgi:hypothetical protein